ncbi:hypothetical protein LTR86_001367 [Recurvomyces mirabilis]|nr:hypothetical protein LTR86_001367 [Recurvomyces mirabilis]
MDIFIPFQRPYIMLPVLRTARPATVDSTAKAWLAGFHTTPLANAKDTTASPADQQDSLKAGAAKAVQDKPEPHKTQAQLDEELKQKLAGISGDGGDAGVEYEDGQPVSMKRSVKNNMFRYI